MDSQYDNVQSESWDKAALLTRKTTNSNQLRNKPLKGVLVLKIVQMLVPLSISMYMRSGETVRFTFLWKDYYCDYFESCSFHFGDYIILVFNPDSFVIEKELLYLLIWTGVVSNGSNHVVGISLEIWHVIVQGIPHK